MSEEADQAEVPPDPENPSDESESRLVPEILVRTAAASAGTTNLLTTDWLMTVIGTHESDLRAHRTALTYSKFAGYLDDLIHGKESVSHRASKGRSAVVCNANWFHFATWGTVTITANIANERPPQRIDMLPLTSVRRRLTPKIIQLRAASGQRVSRALAWGQRLIFVSVCHTLVHLAERLEDDPPADPADFGLVDEANVPTPTGQEIIKLGTWQGYSWIKPERHLRVITDAFRLYLRARDTSDATFRARCVLGANVLLTAVEQDLVDPALEAVVSHIPRTVASAVDQRLARWTERWTGVPAQVAGLQLPFRYTGARELLDAAWSRLMTDQVFVLALPTETLRLGRDIPPLRPGQPYFPTALRDLRAQPDEDAKTATGALADVLEDVAQLIEALDRTSGNGRGSAARDWRRWDERMNWALTLMRSRQQDETLFWSPYSREDRERIVRGELPRRMGDPSALEVQAPIDDLAFADAAAKGEI